MNESRFCKVCGEEDCELHRYSYKIKLDFVKCPKCDGHQFWVTEYFYTDDDYNCQNCGHRTIFDGLEEVKNGN